MSDDTSNQTRVLLRSCAAFLLLGAVGLAHEPAAPRVSLLLNDAHLTVVPAAGHVRLVADGKILSQGHDWEVKSLASGGFHLRLRSWPGSYWSVQGGRVHEVSGGRFGHGGGKRRLLGIKVRLLRDPAAPQIVRYRLALPDVRLDLGPGESTLRYGHRLVATHPTIRIVTFDEGFFQVKVSSWRGVFWQVDVEENKVCEVRGGRFGGLGGMLLPAAVSLR